MTRKKVDVKCPWCGGVYAASGMTAHVRHKHPGKEYDEFRANREAIIEKNKVVEGQPAPVDAPEPDQVVEDPAPAAVETPAPVEKKGEPVEKQQTGSFLGSVGKALRDW